MESKGSGGKRGKQISLIQNRDFVYTHVMETEGGMIWGTRKQGQYSSTSQHHTGVLLEGDIICPQKMRQRWVYLLCPFLGQWMPSDANKAHS